MGGTWWFVVVVLVVNIVAPVPAPLTYHLFLLVTCLGYPSSVSRAKFRLHLISPDVG